MPIPSVVPHFDAAAASASASNDAVLLIASKPSAVTGLGAAVDAALAAAGAADRRFDAQGNVTVLAVAEAAGHRVVVSPAGPLTRDWDDPRMIADAVKAGVKRAVAAGATRPLLVLAGDLAKGAQYRRRVLVALLAALDAAYAPIAQREFKGEAVAEPVVEFGLLVLGTPDFSAEAAAAEIATAVALESGRRVAKDICGGDPERMAPPRIVEYLEREVATLPGITMTVESDWDRIHAEYPLLHAVARASVRVERHLPRVVRLEYRGDGAITEQIFFAGKGVTYDTGGADIKTGGYMTGMKRDKGGAAAAAGFVRAVAALRPSHLRVVAYLGLVRNSIGSECFVSDEVIVGHAGKRVLIVNTDAEGRLVLADLLSHIREEIKASAAPDSPLKDAKNQVFSVATLTGHAVIAYGKYSIAVDSATAAAAGTARRIQASAHLVADPFEVSTLRREDYDFVAPKNGDYDVYQCNTAPSSQTPRGHQFPMAFLVQASGLGDHSATSDLPVSYTHLDIAGSAGFGSVADGFETGAPVVGLAATYVLHAAEDGAAGAGAGAAAGGGGGGGGGGGR